MPNVFVDKLHEKINLSNYLNVNIRSIDSIKDNGRIAITIEAKHIKKPKP